MTTTHASAALQSHVSIDTADLARSTAFYQALLGCILNGLDIQPAS